MATLPKAYPSTRTAKAKPAVVKMQMPVVEAQEIIPAAKAKAHLLQLLDRVEADRKPITITKRGRVVAQLIPPPAQEEISNFDRIFGSMKGTGRILGDIVSPDWESWGPEWR